MFAFVVGAVAGYALGATITPVNLVMTEIITGSLLKPITDGVRLVGPLGLGTILGATALTTAMTVAVVGVSVAASTAMMLLRLKKSATLGGFAWLAAGFAGAVSTTCCGFVLGKILEKNTMNSGVVALLWALGIFTVLKTLIHIIVQLTFKITDDIHELAQEQRKLEAIKADERERVTVTVEQNIRAFENYLNPKEHDTLEFRAAWEAQRQNREEIDQRHKKAIELILKKASTQERLSKAITRYVELLAFSGIPMTVTAGITAGLGIFGFGDYRFVFVVLLALVLFMAFILTRSVTFNFWVFTACMGMFATFVIAVLTVHAGQEALEMMVKMRQAGVVLSKEEISAKMDHQSSVEAVTAGFFVARLCQAALGATVGGSLNLRMLDKVTVGTSVITVVLLLVVDVLSESLGAGAVTGAFLGVLGAAGVSLGAAASKALQCSSLTETLSTTAGMLLGALVIGKWDFLNIILHVLIAFTFALVNPF